MGESSQRRLLRSRENIGTIVLRKMPRENLSRIGLVAWALWPDDPVATLATRAKCTKRAAQFYITGDREPSYEALMVVLDELRPRKRA